MLRISPKIRAMLSGALLLVFGIVAITGVGLFLAPPGRIANDLGWTFLGFGKHELEEAHTLFGFAFVLLVAAHFLINWGTFTAEVRALLRRG